MSQRRSKRQSRQHQTPHLLSNLWQGELFQPETSVVLPVIAFQWHARTLSNQRQRGSGKKACWRPKNLAAVQEA
eukprot:12280846-Prorocentrum_lima.AAC.1